MIMIASAIRYSWISNVAIQSFLNMVGPKKLDTSIFPDKDIQKNYQAQNLNVKGYLIIQTCSFLDEYKLFHKFKPEDPAELEASIRFKKEVKAILKPAISYINDCWKDLYKTRNQMLAHGWRVDGGDAIMFTDAVHYPVNAPLIDEEFTLLIGIIGSMIDVMEEYNPDYIAEVDTFMQERVKIKPPHLTPTTSHEFSKKEFLRIKALMRQELRAIQNQE